MIVNRPNNVPLRLYVLGAVLVSLIASLSVHWISDNRIAVVLGIAAVGGIVLLLRPAIGLYVLLFVVYINLSSVIVNVHGGPSILKPYLPFLLTLTVAHMLYKRERPPSLGHVVPILLCYGSVIIATLLIARDTQLTLDGLEAFIKDAVIVVTIVLVVRSKPTLRAAIWAMLAGGIFLGTISMWQQVTGNFSNTYWGFAQTHIVVHIVGDINSFRIAGPIQTNFYAMIMLSLVPLALDRAWSERIPALKLLAAYTALICILTVVFSFSRGGFLGLGVAIVAWLFYRRISVKTLIVIGIFALIALSIAPSTYTQRLATITDILTLVRDQELVSERSLRGRMGEQIAAWRMFIDHPVLGVGYDNFDVYYLDYSDDIGLDNRRDQRQAHNLYLEVVAETGLVGMVVFAMVLILAFRSLWQAKQLFYELKDDEHVALMGAIQASVLGLLTSSIFLHAAFPRYFWLYMSLAFAVPAVARTAKHSSLSILYRTNPVYNDSKQ